MLVLRCRDLGSECQWEGHAETEEEIFEMAKDHGAAEHGMEKMSDEFWEKARAAIRDE